MKGGVLIEQPRRGRRIALALSASILVLPALLLHSSGVSKGTGVSIGTVTPSSDVVARAELIRVEGSRASRGGFGGRGAVTTTTALPVEVAATTITTTATTTLPETTTAAPKPKPTVTTAKPTTTTTRPTTTAPPVTKPPTQGETGSASWYDTEPGGCAHRTLAIGTVLTVTNRANGKSVTCRVHDRGPFVDGRIIDIERSTFASIATTSSGVITVSVTW